MVKLSKEYIINILMICLLVVLSIFIHANKVFAKEDEGQVLEEGTYIIRSAMNKNFVLDLNGPSKDNCANISLWQDNGGDNQKYKLKYVGDGFYTISSVYSGKYLDVAWASKNNGANIEQYEFNGADNQKWLIKKDSDGEFCIVSKCNNLYVDIEAAKCANGSNALMWQYNGGNNQKFIFEKIEKPITPQKTIDDGIYTVSVATNENYVFDIENNSKNNCANVNLWEYKGHLNQKFQITYLNDGYYKITSISSGKVLDVAYALKDNGARVEQYDFNGGDNQKWIIAKAENGGYNIISKCNNLYLGIGENSPRNGANIATWKKEENNNQILKLTKVENGEKTISDGKYVIKPAYNTNYALDVTGASKDNGANIELWWDNGANNQKFDIKYSEDGYYTITSAYTKKSLDVAWSSKMNGANLQQYEHTNNTNQKWIIKRNEDSTYSIISICNNLYVDVVEANYVSGTNIDLWQYNGGANQKFIFEKTTMQSNLDIDSSKYPGYQERIESLIEAHPNWKFELLYTGVKFSDAVAGEYSVRKRNLVPTDYGGEWIAGTTLYDSGWYAASEKAIAYYMDPRNFLNNTDIFQFQDVNDYLYGVCTLEGIKSKISNTFLKNYADDINVACKNKNVNPYYIIARIIQEQGNNGTTIGRGMDGGDGKIYYNPFNISASGDTWEEIYTNALARAKQEGWDTMEKALEGGIYFCKENWLDNYQNTLYQNRFDIDTRNGTALYTHQYMQNLMGAYSEARILRSSYANTGKLESEFTFIIPLYEGMEATLSPMPVNSQESYSINVKTTGTYVRIRSDASTDSKILRELPTKGTILLSVQRGINSNWQKVITSDGLIGYISGDYVTQIDDVTTCNYTANVKTNDGDGCNVRIGPSTRLDKVTALSDGVSVTVIDDSTYKNIDGYDWSRVRLSSGTQVFIPSKYLVRQ